MRPGVSTDGGTMVVERTRSRLAASGVLVFAATLPLQWQVVTQTPLGILRYFHVGALVMVLLARPDRLLLRQLRMAASPAASALAVITVLGIFSALFYAEFSGDQFQHFGYAVVGLFGAGALIVAMSHPEGRSLLLWTGPVAVSSFVLFFTLDSYSVGLNPLEAVRNSLFSGSPEALQFLIRAVFETGGQEDVRYNTRHEIFLSLLVALYISWATSGRHGSRSRAILLATTFAVGVMVAVSLSRAAILAAGLVAIAVALRAIGRARLNLAVVSVVMGLAFVAPFVAGPLFDLVQQRIFEDTQSYEGRLAAFDVGGKELLGRLVGGGPSELESTHTMIGDAALRSGIFAALAALVLVGVFAVHTFASLRRFFGNGSLNELMIFGAGALVLTRAFTAGGGLLHQVEWTAFGLVIAMEVWRTRTGGADPTGPDPGTDLARTSPGGGGAVLAQRGAILPKVDAVPGERSLDEFNDVGARRIR